MAQNCLAAQIIFCGQWVKVACDGHCEKAWGINSRPRLHRTVTLEYQALEPDQIFDESICPDPDDECYLADQELGEAPRDPGTYEGDDAKPTDYSNPDRIRNRWCVRECERCVMASVDGPLFLPDFSKRRYNMEPHERD